KAESPVVPVFVHHRFQTSGPDEVMPAMSFEEKLHPSLPFKGEREVFLRKPGKRVEVRTFTNHVEIRVRILRIIGTVQGVRVHQQHAGMPERSEIDTPVTLTSHGEVDKLLTIAVMRVVSGHEQY